MLIEMIERLDLHKFDDGKYKSRPSYNNVGGVLAGIIAASRAKKQNKTIEPTTPLPAVVYQTNNGIEFTIAKNGENIKTISARTGVSVKKLLKYNDLFSVNFVADGDKVYMSKKKSKSTSQRFHEVEKNENMHDISQRFGVTIKSLLKRNPEYLFKQPLTGVHIYLN